MRIIIDINIAQKVLIKDDDKQYYQLHNCIFFKKYGIVIKIAYGGKLTQEYYKNHKIRRILLVLDRAGKAIHIDDKAVNSEAEVIKQMKICVSDDEHIIALARTGNVRLLASNDSNLCKDFKNTNLINKPKGKIYSSPKHSNLLINPGS
ncbi:MAG: hypothetical protein K8R74_14710 [Bacteroidales bacterium]|nr:hypothetical protein [Bacteroidales bacterium]